MHSMTINETSLKIDTTKFIRDLQRLIRIPSVSAKKQNLEECAKGNCKNYERNWNFFRINIF